MKSIQLIILLIFTLLSGSGRLFAQLDYSFAGVKKESYKPLEKYDQQFPLSEVSTYVDLGFELNSWGTKCAKLGVQGTYCFLNFDPAYNGEIAPIMLPDFDLNLNQGNYRIQRFEKDKVKYFELEFSQLEYVQFPGEQFSMILGINSLGNIYLHYGANTLKDHHPLLNAKAHIMVIEEDYDKTRNDFSSGNNYYRSIVNPFGNPNAPTLNNQEKTNQIDRFPEENTLYTIQNSKLAGVTELAKNELLIITPNPATSSCEVQLNGLGATSVQVMDLTGKICISKTVQNSDRIKFDLTGIASGEYLIRAMKETEVIAVSKLLVE